jgi:LPXTG-motif cell wall-anchored protein
MSAVVAMAAIGLTPAAAPAQSGGAGGDQYQDPFGSNSQQQSGGSSGSGTSSPAPTQTPAPSTTGSNGQTATTAAPAASSSKTLPRTGVDVRIVAAIGAVLLLAGTVLRRRLRHERL